MRMARAAWLVLGIVSVAPGVSGAAEWYMYGTSESDDKYHYVDVSSIATVGASKRAWFQMVEADGTSSTMLVAFRCRSREYGQVSFLSHDERGKSTGSQTTPQVKFEPVVPDTVGERMLAVACATSPRALIMNELDGLKVSGTPREHAAMLREAIKRAAEAPAEDAAAPADAVLPSEELL